MDTSAENRGLAGIKAATEKMATSVNKSRLKTNKLRLTADKNKITPFRPRPTLLVDVLPESESKSDGLKPG
ncbi:MAG: hypothetical protein ABSB91_08940 [Sedimentisphaerales bacterium]|jgi:hypothetical protein